MCSRLVRLCPVLGINRNIVECKFGKVSPDPVLRYAELIETLWNVNTHDAEVIDKIVRINRNIVECKLSRTNRKISVFPELIDTYWNVDYYHN